MIGIPTTIIVVNAAIPDPLTVPRIIARVSIIAITTVLVNVDTMKKRVKNLDIDPILIIGGTLTGFKGHTRKPHRKPILTIFRAVLGPYLQVQRNEAMVLTEDVNNKDWA
jgi:hypothetical protein